MIISGSASISLASSLSSHSKIPLGKTTHQNFPDGEFMVQTNFKGDHGIIIAATRSASDHLELLQLQDAVREAGATNITTYHGSPALEAIAKAISDNIIIEPTDKSIPAVTITIKTPRANIDCQDICLKILVIFLQDRNTSG